jgi:hypothetical protein
LSELSIVSRHVVMVEMWVEAMNQGLLLNKRLLKLYSTPKKEILDRGAVLAPQTSTKTKHSTSTTCQLQAAVVAFKEHRGIRCIVAEAEANT